MSKINIHYNPDKNLWDNLVKRPTADLCALRNLVQSIFTKVKDEGNRAVQEYTKEFDGVDLPTFEVTEQEIQNAHQKVPDELKKAIIQARKNIHAFHKAQRESKKIIETMQGVRCWRESRPVEKIGIYIPGGTAPLFSTVLMLAVPAQIAGCREIVLCSPPDKSGNIHPAVLYSASITGISKIYKTGGIQAIAAMALGTSSVPKVYKIFGPGNQYVTAAKQYAQELGIATDMPAGPSEVLVIADKYANPQFIAADLLAQAEHGTDSQVVLLTDTVYVLEQTLTELSEQLKNLPRHNLAQKTLENSLLIHFDTLETCFEFANYYAPEHLILALKKYKKWTSSIHNAGSVFLGKYTCETAGDYASGTNHTLPTAGFAKMYSGVSLDSFVKKITFQHISRKGLLSLGNTLETLAAHEQLLGHKNAVTVRLNTLKKS